MGGGVEDLEKITEDFLRQNDPLYTARSKNFKMDYPYLTQRQAGIRASKEIPVSNLSNKQKKQCRKLGDMITYDEKT